MDVQRVRHADLFHRVEQRRHDPAGRETVAGDLVVEAELQHAVLEGRGTARIDALDAQTPRMGQRLLHEIADRVLALAVAQELEQVVVVAQHRETAAVEQRDVGEFEMGRQRVRGRQGRFDRGGVAHPGVVGADPAPRTAGVRKGMAVGRGFAHVEVGQQQAAHHHVAAGDVRVNLDAAGHDHAAGGVDGLVGRTIGGGDDAASLDPDVADAVATGCRIDHPSAVDAGQHETPFSMRRSRMRVSRPAAVCASAAAFGSA